MRYRIVRFIERESRMLVARDWRQLVSDGYRVSVGEEEKNSGDEWW